MDMDSILLNPRPWRVASVISSILRLVGAYFFLLGQMESTVPVTFSRVMITLLVIWFLFVARIRYTFTGNNKKTEVWKV